MKPKIHFKPWDWRIGICFEWLTELIGEDTWQPIGCWLYLNIPMIELEWLYMVRDR